MNNKEIIKWLRDEMLKISETTNINFSTMTKEEFDKWVYFIIKRSRRQ